MRLPLALMLVAALALAGCASDPPSTTPARASATPVDDALDETAADEGGLEREDEEVAPLARTVTTFVNGTITSVGAGSSDPVGLCCLTLQQSGEHTEGTFTPEPGVVGIVVELKWSDPTFDLDLIVMAPDYEQLDMPELNGTSISGSRGHAWFLNQGQLGSPDGHTVARIVEPEVVALGGEWAWRLATKTANAVPFTVAVSLFYGDAPPEAFTALGP